MTKSTIIKELYSFVFYYIKLNLVMDTFYLPIWIFFESNTKQMMVRSKKHKYFLQFMEKHWIVKNREKNVWFSQETKHRYNNVRPSTVKSNHIMTDFCESRCTLAQSRRCVNSRSEIDFCLISFYPRAHIELNRYLYLYILFIEIHLTRLYDLGKIDDAHE